MTQLQSRSDFATATGLPALPSNKVVLIRVLVKNLQLQLLAGGFVDHKLRGMTSFLFSGGKVKVSQRSGDIVAFHTTRPFLELRQDGGVRVQTAISCYRGTPGSIKGTPSYYYYF